LVLFHEMESDVASLIFHKKKGQIIIHFFKISWLKSWKDNKQLL